MKIKMKTQKPKSFYLVRPDMIEKGIYREIETIQAYRYSDKSVWVKSGFRSQLDRLRRYTKSAVYYETKRIAKDAVRELITTRLCEIEEEKEKLIDIKEKYK